MAMDGLLMKVQCLLKYIIADRMAASGLIVFLSLKKIFLLSFFQTVTMSILKNL